MAAVVARLAVLWGVAAAALWLHAVLGIPGTYLDQGYPLSPGLKVTYASLASEAALFTLPVPLAAALGRRFRLRLVMLPVIGLLWLWAAHQILWSFVIDLGTTWLPFEPLQELFLHPIHTPLALAALFAASWWALTRQPATA